MKWDLGNEKVMGMYQGLSVGRTARVMVDIINKFYNFHNTGNLHGKIMPANILMNGDDFTHFRIANYEISEVNDKELLIFQRFFYRP